MGAVQAFLLYSGVGAKAPLCKGVRSHAFRLRWHGVSRDGGIVQ